MASIFDVAKYILHRCGKMSTMKLQKLCYYSQAWSLVWDDKALFDENFEAWANGPVCRELFMATKGQFSVTEDDENGNIDVLTDTQKETINAVLKYYEPHNAQWLSQLTHMENPWKEARKELSTGERCTNIITTESMAIYYGGL